jgi:hypothetical protein
LLASKEPLIICSKDCSTLILLRKETCFSHIYIWSSWRQVPIYTPNTILCAVSCHVARNGLYLLLEGGFGWS